MTIPANGVVTMGVVLEPPTVDIDGLGLRGERVAVGWKGDELGHGILVWQGGKTVLPNLGDGDGDWERGAVRWIVEGVEGLELVL